EEAVNGTQGTFSVHDARPVESGAVLIRSAAGATDGVRVRVAGKAERGIGGAPAGGLHLIVSTTPHAVFERVGGERRGRVPRRLDRHRHKRDAGASEDKGEHEVA